MSNIVGDLKKHSYFVDYSEVFQIHTIASRKDSKGTSQNFISYKPLFPGNNEGSVIFTEPVVGFDGSFKRLLVSKATANRLLKQLASPPPADYVFDQEAFDEAMKQSRIEDLILMLAFLWFEKERSENDPSTTKRDLFKSILIVLSREISLALGVSPEEAGDKIVHRLKQMPIANLA